MNTMSSETVGDILRLPPYDLDAETAVLGSMALCGDERDRFDHIRFKLRRDAFYQADNQIIYDAMCQMADAGEAIDAVTLRASLVRRGLWEEVGGTAYLASILGSVPSFAHGEHYAETVREKHLLRQIIVAANDALRACYAPAHSVDAARVLARRFADAFAEMAVEGVTDEFRRLSEAVEAVLQRKADGNVPRLPTGLSEMDGMVGGIPFGKFTLVGGRPGMGKSLFCKQVALNAASAGTPVGVVTIEEDEGKVAENALANFSGVENNRIAYGAFGQVEWEAVAAAQKQLGKLDFWLNDKPSRLSEVEEAVTTAALKHKCRLVVVDYLQLISPDAGGENENREITRISQCLKKLAKRLNVALIAACQLNRGNEHGGVRPPALKDLRGSGSLEQDGDLVILLHRRDYYLTDEQLRAGERPDNQLQADVAKNKDGPRGTVPLYFSGKLQLVSDWNDGRGPFVPSQTPETPFD